jgi:histidyl-tRNA synthetase
MSKQKPSLARGTRDYTPAMMLKRNYIIANIKNVFEKFGFLPLETPAMEQLSVLMGKYGEEGDQLLFKILNSGDFLKETRAEDAQKGSKHFALKVSEKGLRYDLTVPFARFVVMNQNDLAFPFKRYQIQPVWRGDSPQRGRYREFYQCDADVVGTESLICEAEIVMMMNDVLSKLNLKEYEIKINNRKILTGIAEVAGADGKEGDLCVAIDKLDKIGREKVMTELQQKGFTDENIQKLSPIFEIQGTTHDKISQLSQYLKNSEIGLQGLSEIQKVLNYVAIFTEKTPEQDHLNLDITLARGLSYYTGAIFEIKAHNTEIGSISGGGRYDNLTGTFGLPNVAGVGFSFGLDRIYDVLEEKNLFPADAQNVTQIMLTNFDENSELFCLKLLKNLRDADIKAEIYPTSSKLDKQMKYANKKRILYVLLVGSQEIEQGKFTLKNMNTGEQQILTIEEIFSKF